MRCLRCGRETEDGTSFCPDCLALMDTQPVKPGTAIVLPAARKPISKPVPTRRIKPEEEIRKLQKAVLNLWLALLCCVLVIIGLGSYIFMKSGSSTKGPIGQNYSTTETTAQPAPGSVSG